MRRLHHVLKRWLVKRRWLVVLEAITDIWAAAIGDMLVCSKDPTNVGKNFRCEIIFA